MQDTVAIICMHYAFEEEKNWRKEGHITGEEKLIVRLHSRKASCNEE